MKSFLITRFPIIVQAILHIQGKRHRCVNCAIYTISNQGVNPEPTFNEVMVRVLHIFRAEITQDHTQR